jgi:methylmalonyl-CoA mutase C-terminal domain/subunit
VLVVGGIVPEPSRLELNGMGVTGIFTPGSSLKAIIDFIQAGVANHRTYQESK